MNHEYKVELLFQARAVALIQKKGGINAVEPNAVKNKNKAGLPGFRNKVQKRLNTSDDDDSTYSSISIV